MTQRIFTTTNRYFYDRIYFVDGLASTEPEIVDAGRADAETAGKAEEVDDTDEPDTGRWVVALPERMNKPTMRSTIASKKPGPNSSTTTELNSVCALAITRPMRSRRSATDISSTESAERPDSAKSTA